MSQSLERSQAAQRPAGNAIINSLYVMAFIVGATSLVGVLFQMSVALSRTDASGRADEIIFIVVAGVAGIAVALLLGAAGVAINYLQMQAQMMHRLVRTQEDATMYLSRMSTAGGLASAPVPAAPMETVAAQPAPWPESPRLDQIMEVLSELNETMLLTPEQRQAKRKQQLQDRHRNLSEILGQLLLAGNFVEAQARLDQYIRLFPDDQKAVEDFQWKIDDARGAVEESEYDQAVVKVRDLTATAAWDRSDEVAKSLLKRHPKSQRVRELADQVRQERAKFQQQHRQHLLTQIESLSSQRQWREAYRLANELVSQFGDSSEGQIIKDKLGTLKDNAEIEIRRHIEEQYKELNRTHRYIEALALAQDVIAKYPGSPQAKVLREQLPQLMSKAKLQMDQAGGV